jgi:hypothetical protein
MTLHTVGPIDTGEDERVIGRAYQTWLTPVYFAAPLVAAHYVDLKWVVAWGIGVALAQLHETGGRLHDLCIRLRRTNLILAERRASQTDWSQADWSCDPE